MLAVAGLAVEQESVAGDVLLATHGNIEKVLAQRAEEVAGTPAGEGVFHPCVGDTPGWDIGACRVGAIRAAEYGTYAAVELAAVPEKIAALDPWLKIGLPPVVRLGAKILPAFPEPGVTLHEIGSRCLEGALEMVVILAFPQGQRTPLGVFGETGLGYTRAKQR